MTVEKERMGVSSRYNQEIKVAGVAVVLNVGGCLLDLWLVRMRGQVASFTERQR